MRTTSLCCLFCYAQEVICILVLYIYLTLQVFIQHLKILDQDLTLNLNGNYVYDVNQTFTKYDCKPLEIILKNDLFINNYNYCAMYTRAALNRTPNICTYKYLCNCVCV